MNDAFAKSGLALVKESVYTLRQLQEYISESCLSDMFVFVFNQKVVNVQTICRTFLDLLSDEQLNLDELTTVFVGVSLLYFIDATEENRELRLHTLEKAFRNADTLNPIHIHIAVKRLWQNLRKGPNCLFNILSICHKIFTASETGAAIAMCLAWAILSQSQGPSETGDMEMYCFQEFRVLLKVLKNDEAHKWSPSYLYAFVQALGFLTNIIVCGENKEFKNVGYRHYFKYSLDTLKSLKMKTIELSDKIKVSSTAKDYWDLHMVIIEYLNTNVISVLQDKIAEMSK